MGLCQSRVWGADGVSIGGGEFLHSYASAKSALELATNHQRCLLKPVSPLLQKFSIINAMFAKYLHLCAAFLLPALLLADNSDFSINSDYLPSRWQAGTDALNMIFNAKCNANAESEVGLMTTAAEPDGSRRPQVLLTPTNDSIKLIAALHGVRQSGEIDLATSIQVAQVRKNRTTESGLDDACADQGCFASWNCF